eukprot:11638095-Alexandrium_andersonii.AAC.1
MTAQRASSMQRTLPQSGSPWEASMRWWPSPVVSAMQCGTTGGRGCASGGAGCWRACSTPR